MNIEGKECPELIPFLLNPSSYPHKPGYVKHIQTHASHVFIVTPYVYKIKKPVNFGFLDFSTLDKRKFYCEREVELNSRLCHAYLGVEEISIRNGNLIFGKDGKTVEYAVKMILDAMGKSLAQGQRIEIRGFGSFGLNYRPPRTGRNPKSGEKVQVPAKYVPHFKAGKELRERVDIKK